MQRLFSSFPNGWPGSGLLLLRIVGSVPSVAGGITALFTERGSLGALWMDATSIAAGSLLLAGFWTPIGGLLQVLAQGYLAFRNGGLDGTRLFSAAIAFSLVMLGPGAWSVDARLYGRKRINVRGKQA